MLFRVPRLTDVRELLDLALPVVIVHLGLMAMGVMDTMMVGRVSAEALAGVALGNLYYFTAAIFGLGTLAVLDPVVAQAAGAGDQEGVARGIQRGLVLAALLAVPIALALWPAPVILDWLGQPPDVVPIAGAYARASIPGTVGMLAFTALKQGLQALHRTRPIVVTIIVANLVNVFLNWVMIFGHLGFPALGAVGSAWATSLTRILLVALLLWLAWPVLRQQLIPFRRQAFASAPLLRMIRLGGPIGIQHQLEYGVFAIVGLLMGTLGTIAVAGHQVAINLASVTFMVPLGISTAAAVVVGHAVGRGDAEATTSSARSALVVAMVFMGSSALLFLFAPMWLARLYTDDADVLRIAAVLIPLAGVFQVFDGIQVTSIGILRGLGDTRGPMIAGLVGYWVLGLPVSLLLGLRLGGGPAGLWWGLVLGLVIVAGFLLWRVAQRLREPLRRVAIDQPIQVEV
ncbi:MAG: MATE family efflux transporter [Gemmatimonadota bacterium]|nr:MATE family efflux transporter [Gemmatimonadota bacterium]MDH5283176.1 MATE family efflux transporter [Gemmatimonadota bacterium]